MRSRRSRHSRRRVAACPATSLWSAATTAPKRGARR
jgi:hypothetical protein